MRVGQNPAKSIESLPQPARVTVAVVVHIPFLSGYYAGMLDVLKACLGSLWQNTPQPYDLLVFDNASCPEVRDYLLVEQRQGRSQYLVLSDKNVGKGGAWNMIFQGAPGEIIAYADSDIYFHPGWLEASLQLLETYPNAGMVTSRPLRTPEKYFTATLDWAKSNPEVRLEQGQFMSWQDFKEHTDSMGISDEQARQWYGESCDWRMQYHDLPAYAGAAHFQFVAPKAALQPLFPIHMDRPMGQVRSLDEKLNEAGMLRLNICQPLVRHLGNRLPEAAPLQAESAQAESAPQAARRSPGLSRRLGAVPVIRRGLLRVYNSIYRIIYP